MKISNDLSYLQFQSHPLDFEKSFKDFLKTHPLIADYAYTEVATSKTFKEYKSKIEGFIQEGQIGKDHYLAKTLPIRENLMNYFKDFKSALIFLFPHKHYKSIFADYVFAFEGRDYHHVIEHELENIAQFLGLLGSYKLSVDRHPVLEKDLAYRAGLGFYGKHNLLIHPKLGSRFSIAALILSETLPFKKRKILKNSCKTCNLCLKACPSLAIEKSFSLDFKKCISYFNTEEKENLDFPYEIPSILGCDLCQNACPFNPQKISKLNLPLDSPFQLFFSKSKKEIIQNLQKISDKEFKKLFQGTSLERIKREKILKNIELLKIQKKI